MSKANGKDERRIIIKRFEVVEGGHHGGSWKIAYADFVTAMMAFFLVMWLINATTEEQRKGIANFFNPIAVQQDAPPKLSVMPDLSPIASSDRPMAVKPGQAAGPNPDDGPSGQNHLPQKDAEKHSAQIVVLHDGQIEPGEPVSGQGAFTHKPAFQNAADQISRALNAPSQLADVRDQVSIQVGDDGLHVEIADSEHQPMFALGSATPMPRALQLLRLVAPYLEKLPGHLSIAGYTDAAPYKAGLPSNWSLSSSRAVAARDVLVQAGFPDRRLQTVSGYADRNLFDHANPLSPRNRRVVLVLSPDQP
ncbi:OmpA family protein [Gluconobacter cerinus]|uniref:flagellar motor protein MotB n=1 Tax=Gluconobacter TaxID=441 RepID=UPI001B8B680C|nr:MULTISPECIES: flagellar motor protein MotB [Gluconobacter]MBS0994416.1 OmpA family protein [Gluconobacter cerinus]MBS1022098.1 OmpA family protein [Gluconobacter cerinus]